MKIQVNGQVQELQEPETLQDFITQNVRANMFLVAELNGDIIKKPRWQEIILSDGDTLELVTLFGGG